MADIKPIETIYNGYRFRSRLEARWAVFFDAAGIEYEYEPQGYRLSDGSTYLPDFYLHAVDGGTWVEVKPCGPDGIFPEGYLNAFPKAIQFAKDYGVRITLCGGLPKSTTYVGLVGGGIVGATWCWAIDAPTRDRAVLAARQARFEHGETPSPADFRGARR